VGVGVPTGIHKSSWGGPAGCCWLLAAAAAGTILLLGLPYTPMGVSQTGTARTARRDITKGRIYSRLGRGPGGVTDHHAARPTGGAHHCREVPRKDDTTATFSLQLERAKWAENFFRLMDGILNMGLAVCCCWLVREK
jgi:hypothetical protein